MYKGYKLAIVVPAYNEEKLIADTLKGMPVDADRIYVIDDGSTDATNQFSTNVSNERISVIRHQQNQGVGAAIVSGYKQALHDGMDVAVVMAGDNQMHAQHLPELLEPIIQGKADYTKGNRLSSYVLCNGMSKWRLFGNLVLTSLTQIASGYWGIKDPQNGYTAITSDTLRKLTLDKVYPRYGYCNDLLIKLNVTGCRVGDVDIPARYGKEKSKLQYDVFIFTVLPLLLRGFLWRLWMKYLTNHSKPIQKP